LGGGKLKTYTITLKGQVTIPAEVREKLKLQPGDRITYEDTTAGILLRPAKKDLLDDFGFMKGFRRRPDIKSIRKTVRKKMARGIH
jgi:AbrB family looped-hinge helix DNA binding protein